MAAAVASISRISNGITRRPGTKGRFVPSSYTCRRDVEGGVIFHSPDKRFAMAFRGDRTQPDFHNQYATDVQFWAETNQWVREVEEETRARKGASTVKTNRLVQVGDIFVNTWGYEQTNVDAYQVVRLIGKKTVELREVALMPVSAGPGMSDRVVPIRDEFCKDETFRKRIKVRRFSGEGLAPSVAFSYGGCDLWDGEKSYHRSWWG